MIGAGPAAWLLMMLGAYEAPNVAAPRPPGGSVSVRHQQIIIRVPSGLRRVAPAGASLIQWQESRGPRCVAASQLIGATFIRQNSVDLILRDRSRVRAQLQRRCPALDYYRGFYINATADGRICADRDSIRSRAGGECQIDQFRTLTASRRAPAP